MAIYLDFVGLNTLIHEPLSSSTNTIGYPFASSSTDYINNTVVTLDDKYHLVGLNIHRNGLYGFSTFKQIRTSHNPLTRHHNANSTFSYVIDGKEVKTNARQSFIPKHGALRQIEESPIVSNNKPLTMIGGVSEFNRRTLKTYIERVEVQASPTNEIQFFGDKQANRDFGLDDDTHESYEHLTDLYLDGGIDSDDSPIDQFEMLRYQHQIYPRETNSYLEHVRGRYIEWEPGYWKDKQSERIKTNVDNGFGNTIPSQSIWPLDVEDDWQSRTLLSTIGYFTMSSPNDFVFGATKTVSDGFSLPNYLGGAYFWAFDPIHTSISHSWDSGTGEGKIYGKKYGMNSQTGTGLFYDSWIDLFEEADIRIVSSDPKSLTTTKVKDINVRHNINTKDINFQNSDTFYMEIDDASAFTTIENELSHSMVHFWTKDEVSEVGYIYREMDDQGALKRSIRNNNTSYNVLQAAVFTITDEDGTTNTLTGSTDETGLLTFLYGDGATTPNMGNEWNNNIITFGDPVQNGSGSISLHVNGAQIDHTNLSDQLNFFNPSGDMNTDFVPFQKTSALGLTSLIYKKAYNASLGSTQYLSNSTVSLDFTTDQSFFTSFYFKMDRDDFEITGPGSFDFKLFQLEKSGTSGEMYVRIHTGLHNLLLTKSVFMEIYIEDESGNFSKGVYNITSHYNRMTKYVIIDTTALTYPSLIKYVVDDMEQLTPSLYSSGSSGVQNLWGVSVIDVLQVYEDPASLSQTDSQSGSMIADLMFLSSSNILTPGYAINDGATVDFTSSNWPQGEPLGWWRFNVDGEDNAPSTWLSGTPPIYLQDRTSNNHDLGTIGNIDFSNETGPPRQKTKPLGFQTSSVGETYVLCASSSGNNISTDDLTIFQGAKVAEFAIFPSHSATDIELLIPLETTPDKQKLYTFKDFSTLATNQQPKVWYSFDSSDSITATSATIANKQTSYSSFNINTTYAQSARIPVIENDGLESGSTFTVEYQVRIASQGPQQIILDNSTAIPTSSFVSSSIIGRLSDFFIGGASGYNSEGGAGILMNSYNSFNVSEIPTGSAVDLDTYLSAACLYARRHTLKHSSSFQHPFLTSSFFVKQDGILRDFDDFEIFQGMAKWDAGSMSGKNPFYDDYGKYASEMRLTNKDYTVVPEYRISNHVDKFLLKGDTEFDSTDAAMLEIIGSNKKQNSNIDGFYDTYSTTDFLKMFDLIQEEHDEFVNPISLKLKCKAVKKFLPYKGFYPADRTVEISKQFYNSYKEYLTLSSSYGTSSAPDYAVQNLLTPLFSPGILFNTVKSGVACDYPIMTGSFVTSSYQVASDLSPTGTYHINDQFHRRIPFEAIVEPEKYLANQPLYPQEPDPLGDLDISVTWNGGGDEKYRLMVSNFLAETGEFFLRNKDFASISSLPEGDPNFGNAEAGKTYMMRIKMYRTISGDKELWDTLPLTYYTDPQPQKRFSVPQDNGSMEQAFMMYSRPSAFGPPQRIVLSGSSPSSYNLKFTNWSAYKKADSIDTFYNVSSNVVVTPHNNPTTSSPFEDLRVDLNNDHDLIGNDADNGYNYPFTPPYYHGDAWADITFRASSTEKLTLSQVINSSSVEFLRFYEPMIDHEIEGTYVNWRLVNEDAMQIASSINIFSKGVLEQDITQTERRGIRNDVQVKVDTNVGNQYRWIIQSKFETPILDFSHLTHNTPEVSLPLSSKHTTPIGMWHQYGRLPQKPDDGVFLQVTDVPGEWIDNAMNAESYQTGSLVELCGFSTDPVRLGDIAPTKTIKEAVVAIPFVDKDGQKSFFRIDREDIQNALGESTRNLVGKTVIDMVERMKDYVFPPSMDFLNNDDLDPFAMYIFEFKHVLGKQDLADIWQNLPPDIGEYHEESEAVISHELLSHELLGGKASLKPGRNIELELNRQVRKDKIDSKIRWMVFKVKQRAKTNYFEKIFARNESQESGAKFKKATLSSTGNNKKASYNWPYDYFSLVELVKMEAEIDFTRPDDENQEEKLVIKPYTKGFSNSLKDSVINNGLFGTELDEESDDSSKEEIPKGKKRRQERRERRAERRSERRSRREDRREGRQERRQDRREGRQDRRDERRQRRRNRRNNRR